MRTIRANQSEGIWRKICVVCGYDGAEVRGDLGEIGYQCPQCGQDLYARSPMSYAEMEGLVSDNLLAEQLEQSTITGSDAMESCKPCWWARVVLRVGTFFKLVRIEQDA